MADLTITAASVLASGGATTREGVAGAAITAGQVLYEDTTGTWKLADNDSGTGAVRSPDGIALNSAAAGQPLKILTKGPITIGATLTPGVAYYLSGTPGGICPVADLSTGDYPTIIGIAKSTTVLDVNIQESGVAL